MSKKCNFIFIIPLTGYLIFSLCACENKRQQPNTANPGIITGISADNTAHPEDISSIDANFLKIQMVDSEEGWAGSLQGVYITENGGDDWADITPAPIRTQYNIQSSFFLDENCAWIMPYQETQTKYVNSTVIFRTLDKGVHWEKFELSQTNMGANLFFINKNKGWMTISQGMSAGQHPFDFYTAEDGGKTWDKIHSVNMDEDSSIPLSGLISGLYFIDAQTGWLTGHTNIGLPIFMKTVNGGVTWKDVALPYQESSLMDDENYIPDSSVRVGSPTFFSDTYGLISVEYLIPNSKPYSLFYQTHDGGKSWLMIGEKIVYNELGSLKYSFADKDNGWLITDNKTFMRTVDGGVIWASVNEALSVLSLKEVRDIQFVDKNNGWILDETGLFKSIDSGNTWGIVGR